MSDYYTQFCVVLDFKKKSEQDYIRKLYDTICKVRDADSPDEVDISDFGNDVLEKFTVEDFIFDCDIETNGVWIYSMTGGLDAAIEFIQHLLSKFAPKGTVSIQWANTCDNPRPDGFGGGAAVISALSVEVMATHDHLKKLNTVMEGENKNVQ